MPCRKREVLFLVWVEFIIRNGHCILWNALSASDINMWFFSFRLLICWIMLIGFQMLNWSCIPGINSCCFQGFYILRDSIYNTLWRFCLLMRVFVSVFMRDIYFCIVFVYFGYQDIAGFLRWIKRCSFVFSGSNCVKLVLFLLTSFLLLFLHLQYFVIIFPSFLKNFL